MYYVYKEIKYNDTDTISKKIKYLLLKLFKLSSQVGTVQRIKFYQPVNALKLRIK